MYAVAVATIAGSIFPIFQALPQGERFGMEVTGTGFFVDESGLFLTVDHVMAAVPGSSMYYYGNVPDRVCEPVEIECVATDPARDLYLGRVASDYLAPVALSTDAVRPGRSVCLAGYPMAVLATNPQGGMVGNVRRYWQPTFVIDDAEVVIGHRTYAGYIVQHTCLRGMSGGPVFDPQGRVRGMAAATLTRTIPDPDSSPTVLQNGVVVDVEHVRRFIETSCRSSRRVVVGS
jgi:S1-C subfamily serine protease